MPNEPKLLLERVDVSSDVPAVEFRIEDQPVRFDTTFCVNVVGASSSASLDLIKRMAEDDLLEILAPIVMALRQRKHNRTS